MFASHQGKKTRNIWTRCDRRCILTKSFLETISKGKMQCRHECRNDCMQFKSWKTGRAKEKETIGCIAKRENRLSQRRCRLLQGTFPQMVLAAPSPPTSVTTRAHLSASKVQFLFITGLAWRNRPYHFLDIQNSIEKWLVCSWTLQRFKELIS